MFDIIGCQIGVVFHMTVLGVSTIVLLFCGAGALWRPAEQSRWSQFGVGLAALGGLFVAAPVVEQAFVVWIPIFLGVSGAMTLARTRLHVLGACAAFVVGEIAVVLASSAAIRAEWLSLCRGSPSGSCLGNAFSGYAAGSCSALEFGYFLGFGFTGLVVLVQLVVFGRTLFSLRTS